MRRLALGFVFASVSATAGAGDVTYQQYLVPIVANATPGAFGSVWTTELTVSNTGTSTLTLLAPTCPARALSPCSNAVVIDPNTDRTIELVPQQPPPNLGAYAYVQTDQASFFAAELRVRNLSQQPQSWGTEVPIVNISEFRNALRLVDVPDDPAFRVLLRIYGLNQPMPNVVRVHARTSAALVVVDQTVELASNGNQPLNPSPAYAQLAIPPGAAGDRLRIDITSMVNGQPIWAFASVTNNTTQDLALITPQPLPKEVAPVTALATGHWGASGGACLDVTSTKATLIDSFGDFVTFATPAVDAAGHFEVDGTMLLCTVGPPPPPFQVHISGNVQGTTLTITTTGRASTGPMTLTFGSSDLCGGCNLV